MLMSAKPCQIAYFVPDVRKAALGHHRLFGSGPFYVAENIQFDVCEYRGAASRWDQSSSFGYWGDTMVEFMVQNTPGPSVIEDVQAVNNGASGLHHLGFYVDNPRAVVGQFSDMGHELAWRGVLANGVEVFMVDTISLYGHMTELYAPTPSLMEIHNFVRNGSVGFDGADPVRDFVL
jgi:hypothetical protein